VAALTAASLAEIAVALVAHKVHMDCTAAALFLNKQASAVVPLHLHMLQEQMVTGFGCACCCVFGKLCTY
jgi:hypothetical protein